MTTTLNAHMCMRQCIWNMAIHSLQSSVNDTKDQILKLKLQPNFNFPPVSLFPSFTSIRIRKLNA